MAIEDILGTEEYDLFIEEVGADEYSLEIELEALAKEGIGSIYIDDIVDWPSQGFSLSDHDHDEDYAAINHDHDGVYSPADHNHDDDYAALNHNHDGTYEPADSGIQDHIADADIHVTLTQKSEWDSKADGNHDHDGVYEPADSDIQAHLANGDIHVTLTNKNYWNSKAEGDHHHDDLYSVLDHNHDEDYAALNHDHDGVYEPANSNIQDHIANGDIHVTTEDRDNLNSLGELGPESISLVQSIPFTQQLSVIDADLDSNIVFSPNTTGAVDGYRTRVSINGDGVHTVGFSGFQKSGGSFDFDNSKRNSIIFWKEGEIYWYRIYEQVDLEPAGAPEITDTDKAFPGAVGYGADTKGAYGSTEDPTILTVDTLSSNSSSTGTNRGSLRWALAQTFPRVIVFEVSGVIDYTDVEDRIEITNPYLTIYGQTAPGKGITVRGALFELNASDVIIQHMRFLVGDESTVTWTNDIDAFEVSGGSNIIFDHCTFGWSVDETFSTAQGVSNVTVSNCIFKEPFDLSVHFDSVDGQRMAERHSYCNLNYGNNITFFRNLYAYSFGRNPLVIEGNQQIINNYIYATRWAPPMVQNVDNVDNFVDAIGNVIDIFTTDYGAPLDDILYIVNTLTSASRIHVSDNVSDYTRNNPDDTQWDAVAGNSRGTESSTPVTDISGLEILSSDNVKAHVLENAGAFYWNRDDTDVELLDRINTDRGGPLRSSAGDFPATARNMEGTATSGGLENGHDWSAASEDLVFSYNETNGGSIQGPTTITLNQNCANPDEVVTHLNSLLPSGLEAFRIGDYTLTPTDMVGIRTTHAGSGSILEIHDTGTAHLTLGIPAMEFEGNDQTPWDTEEASHDLSIPSDPHLDPDGNTYTNLEEWAYEESYPSSGGGEPTVVAWPFALIDHNHDGVYADFDHDHEGVYAPVSHTHELDEITDAGSIAGMDVWQGTQTEYDGLSSTDPNTIYFIESA